MDRLVYLSMSGAKALMERQDALANNLANASTPGFRADLTAYRAVPVEADGTSSTRVFNLEASAGFDHKPGPVMQTGNPLDVAIRGPGWFVVQTLDGGEAYTRNGGFSLGPDGSLQTATGLTVLGDGGPLVIPTNAEVTVGADGTINARTGNQPPIQVGKLRLVNPPAAELVKGTDGLIRMASGDPAGDDPAVRVAPGALEGSNVSVVEAMVGMIALSRQFEYQMKLMQTAQSNEERAAQLLSLSS